MLLYKCKCFISFLYQDEKRKNAPPFKTKKMFHFSPNYFFLQKLKKVYRPLYLLGFLPLTPTHKMLHQCNIFKENSHGT